MLLCIVIHVSEKPLLGSNIKYSIQFGQNIILKKLTLSFTRKKKHENTRKNVSFLPLFWI